MITMKNFDAARKRAETALSRKANLMEIRLPATDQKTINVGGPSGGTHEQKFDPQVWLSQGYEGVRFIGAPGVGTLVLPTGHDGVAIKVGQHNGIVQFENVRALAGHTRATSFGQQPKNDDDKDGVPTVVHPLYKKFLVRWYGGEVIVPPPSEQGGKRTKWGIFGYQYDRHFVGLKIDATYASEHGDYGHNYAQWGQLNEDLECWAAAECYKNRPDWLETHYVGPQAFIIDRRCVAKSWYQTWSDRGGAGFNRQGACAHWLAEDCRAYGGDDLGHVLAHQRGKGFMASSEGSSYDIFTGQVDRVGGFGMGYIVLRRVLSVGISRVQWQSQGIRVGVNGGRMGSSPGVLLEQSAVYGENRTVEITGVKSGGTLVRDCNTPVIAQWCESQGIDTRVEATLPTAHRRVPLSEGMSR